MVDVRVGNVLNFVGTIDSDCDQQNVVAVLTDDARLVDQHTSSEHVDGMSAEPTATSVSPSEPMNVADYLSLDDIAGEQIKDPDIAPIYVMLASNPEQPGWDAVAPLSEASKTLWRQWPRLSLIDGVIKRRYQ